MAGYSGTPLPRKLGIKEGTVVRLVGAPVGFEGTLGDLAQGARVEHGAESGAVDMTVFFTTSRAELEGRFGEIAAGVEATGSVWIAWPKRASGVPTDLTEDVLRQVILPTGYVDTKVCAIDDTWSGLRFTLRKELRDARGG